MQHSTGLWTPDIKTIVRSYSFATAVHTYYMPEIPSLPRWMRERQYIPSPIRGQQAGVVRARRTTKADKGRREFRCRCLSSSSYDDDYALWSCSFVRFFFFFLPWLEFKKIHADGNGSCIRIEVDPIQIDLIRSARCIYKLLDDTTS